MNVPSTGRVNHVYNCCRFMLVMSVAYSVRLCYFFLFVEIGRKVCDSINDLCCKKYSGHRIKEHKKLLIQTGDKICCGKNGYVSLYEERDGTMKVMLEKEDAK